MRRARIALLAALIALPNAARPHDRPEAVIDDLNARLRREGATVRLLTARAFEHRAEGNWSQAIADFRAALEIAPRNLGAALGCADALVHSGVLDEAVVVAGAALTFAADAGQAAPLHATLARIAMRRENWNDALGAWRASLQAPDAEVDWFLGEAECLARLGRPAEQCDALARAMKRNPSVVLQRAWLHALVDAGRADEAGREIEHGLAGARWRSGWLILRARVHGLRGEAAAHRADLIAALAEIRARLKVARPDPGLTRDAATIQALLQSN